MFRQFVDVTIFKNRNKEVRVSLTGDFDKEILSNAIAARLDGKIKLIYRTSQSHAARVGALKDALRFG